jgi:SAM-dependent methyltransferase
MPIVNNALGESAFATLVRLFVMDVPVPQAAVQQALQPLSVQDGINLGVLSVGRSQVHPAVHLQPTEYGIFAHDTLAQNAAQALANWVMGVADSTRLLEQLTIRRPVELALDLGTGSGYHGILAARHAEKVVLTDVNPRALAYAEFNAHLNGVTNVEFRRGSLFEPVENERFDLIVTNPPFVISPDRTFVYRDAGRSGDDFTRDMVQALPKYLKPGGIAHLLANWIHEPPTRDGDWAAPVAAWLAECDVDGWFFRKTSYDPLEYIYMWNQRLGWSGEFQRYQQTVDRWMRYFAAQSIQAIAYGGIVLHRRTDGRPGRIRADELPDGSLDAEVSSELDRLIAVEDRLEGLQDDELAQQVVEIAPDQRMQQVLRPRDGTFKLAEAVLVRDVGLRTQADVTPALMKLLAAIDGERTVDQALAAVPVEDDSRPEVLAVVRQMLAYGFLRLRAVEAPPSPSPEGSARG